MLAEIMTILTWAVLVAFGAVVRAILGIYKAYNTYPDFHLEWRRISFEIFASIFFGAFGFYFLQELGVLAFGLNFAAPLAGLFGADAIKLITKRFGLTKGLEVVVSEQQMKNAELNDRQVKALEYVKRYGRITNSIYQKINFVGHDVAKRELQSLMQKGKLVKAGYNKNSFYTTADSLPGDLRAISGAPKTIVRKMHHKTPSQNPRAFDSRLEAQKRISQHSRLRR